MAEVNRRFSPYNYVENDPLRMTDPDGMDGADPNTLYGEDARNWAHDNIPQHKKKKGKDAANDGKPAPGAPYGTRAQDVIKLPVDDQNLPHVTTRDYIVTSQYGGFFSNDPSPGMAYNPYMETYAEEQSAAWTELGIAGGEIGGEFLGPAAETIGGWFKGAGAVTDVATDVEELNGSFSISNWEGYPDIVGGAKPDGPFRLLEGQEYQDALNSKNIFNKALHNANPEFQGLHIHEVQPIKFGGSPTDMANKLLLTPVEHYQYTNYWNAMMRELMK